MRVHKRCWGSGRISTEQALSLATSSRTSNTFVVIQKYSDKYTQLEMAG